MKQNFKISIVTIVCFFSISCETDRNIGTLVKNTAIYNSKSIYNYIKSLGYADSTIEDRGEKFIVEGDMVFNKSDYAYLINAKEEQAYHPNQLIYNEKKQTIKIKVHPSVNKYHQEIDNAIEMWNNVNLYRLPDDPIPNSKIRLLKITNGIGDILIEGGRLGFRERELANAETPSNGNPGKVVSLNLNTKEFPAQLRGHQIAIIAHELGHAIGFQHTNYVELGETGNRVIPGTTKSERGSLMNQETNKTLQGLGLTQMDRRALRVLYPTKPYNLRWLPGTLAVLAWDGPVHRVKSYTVTYTVETGDIFLPPKTFTKEVAITGRSGQYSIPFSCQCRFIRYTANVKINYVDGRSSGIANAPSLTR